MSAVSKIYIHTFSSIEQRFDFGKYKGFSIEEVWSTNIGYIEWCIRNVEYFYILDYIISQLNDKYPKIRLSNEAMEKLIQEGIHNAAFHGTLRASTQDNRESDEYIRTYGRYRGSYAQDQAGFSDEDIDEVLEGDPDNYWNLD